MEVTRLSTNGDTTKLLKHVAHLSRLLGFLEQLDGTLSSDGYRSYNPTRINLETNRLALIKIINEITR